MKERILNEEELRNVIAHADSQQQYDRRRQDERLLEGIVKWEEQKEGISVSTAYEIGEELDIPREYLQRAIEMLYPGKEQVVKDIETVGSQPSALTSHRHVYNTYVVVLEEALQQGYPGERFHRRELFYYPFWEAAFYLSRERWNIFKKIKKKRLLAEITFYANEYNRTGCTGCDVSINLYDPLFLRATGEKLKELKGSLQEYLHLVKLTHHYDPHE